MLHMFFFFFPFYILCKCIYYVFQSKPPVGVTLNKLSELSEPLNTKIGAYFYAYFQHCLFFFEVRFWSDGDEYNNPNVQYINGKAM